MHQLPRGQWSDKVFELILDIENSKGALNGPAIGKETVATIQNLVRIENAIRSNKIEGNHTTYADFEAGLEQRFPASEQKRIKVLENINHYKAESFIDERLQDFKDKIFFSHLMIRETHKILMCNIPLASEGVKEPGAYRKEDVRIHLSDHIPPNFNFVYTYMDELINYANSTSRITSLVNTAIAHHRFTWIHPFKNGNGRMSRLFSYLMLKYYGLDFNGMVSLPRAFERNKSEYYNELANADQGNIESWIKYFLTVLLSELNLSVKRLKWQKKEESFDLYLGKLVEIKKININEKKCIKIAFFRGVLDNERIMTRLNVSRATSTRLLKGLTDKNFIQSLGHKKGYKLLLNSKNPLMPFFLA